MLWYITYPSVAHTTINLLTKEIYGVLVRLLIQERRRVFIISPRSKVALSGEEAGTPRMLI